MSPTASTDLSAKFMNEKAQMMQNIAVLQKQFLEQQNFIKMMNQRMLMAQRQNALLKMVCTEYRDHDSMAGDEPQICFHSAMNHESV